MEVRKRSLLAAALLVAAVVVFTPSIAMANYAVHGGYSMSTDACAGCHRAHTAASPLTWTNTASETRSALLLGTADTIEEFCLTCHGTGALGADTNVWDGVYDADDGTGNDDSVNSYGQALNGGGFDPTMFPTQHYGSETLWVAYGAGPTGTDGPFSTGGEQVVISCAACHDVHGSSNYRLLKDQVAGIDPLTGDPAAIAVGGYDPASPDPQNPVPQPFVISSEVGYPAGGWLLHDAGALQMANYYPDYTDPRYAKPPANDPAKGISAWCAACHTQYNTKGDSGVVTDTDPTVSDGDYLAEHYDANDGYGYVVRHRHPVNVAMSTYLGARSLIVTDNPLPLAHDAAEAGSWSQQSSDWIDCLTCHVAHGSGAKMTGYAAIADATDLEPDSSYGITKGDGLGSVPPDDGNALLRGDNRYVCEACHNK